MKRTPWFKYMQHYPVRDGKYEWRCDTADGGIVHKIIFAGGIPASKTKDGYSPISGCSDCQWRGIYKE